MAEATNTAPAGEGVGDWAYEVAKDIREKWMATAFMTGGDFALPAGHLSDMAEALRSAHRSGKLVAPTGSDDETKGAYLTGYAEFTPISVRSSTGEQSYGDVSDRDLIAAVEPVLQDWIDWCGQNDETPEAHSGAVMAVKAIRAALAPSDAPSTTEADR